MAAATRLLASAIVVSLMVGGTALTARAQAGAGRSPVPPAARIASFAPGSILGIIRDERGKPVAGVVVSALGATTTVAVSDQDGRFEFGTLSPGPYLLRAHLAGFVAPRARSIQVSPNARATSAIALRRVGSMAPVLAAGVAIDTGDDQPTVAAPATADDGAEPAPVVDESETVWRIRHARRGVLKDAAIPAEWLVEADNPASGSGGWTAVDVLGRAVGSQARSATNFFVDTPFSGQVNLLTSGSFNSPEQLLSTENLPSNIAFARLGAPVGEKADWSVRGALTQADISSWIVAGSYRVRAPARHRYDVGLSYATQRYDGGNLLALHDVADGTRNAAEVYGYDSMSLSPAFTLTYGGTFARYDYLEGRSLLSPRVELTVMPVEGFRLSGAVARRALAPGAEEFLSPADGGVWLPPQRTFSSLDGQAFEAEHTTHAEAAVEKDFGKSTIALRAFRQRVDNQLVTLFGADVPGRPVGRLGHYVVGVAGDADAAGCSAGFRTMIAGRVHGGVEYSMASASLTPDRDVRYLMLLAPSGVRPARERIHDLSTTIETEVPETATRILVLYRLSNGFAHPANRTESSGRPALDGRFDIQVRQSLPFMNFSSARWEMLLAVRNFFRETGTDQSVYDELMVVRPPKRVVGGVTLRF